MQRRCKQAFPTIDRLVAGQIETNSLSRTLPDVKCQAKQNKVEPLSRGLDIPLQAERCPSGSSNCGTQTRCAPTNNFTHARAAYRLQAAILLKKLTIAIACRNLRTYYGTRKFITVFTTACSSSALNECCPHPLKLFL
jgi:ATP-dependent helicase YprA (DUF1998 family)